MQKHSLLTKVLLYQSLGFLALIAVSWLVELTGLRSLILGDHPYISDFGESALEMLFALVVWLLVMGSTRRMLKHVQYLQGFMRVCAWCRHIHYKDEWIRLEQFMKEGFDTPTTHGICPECLAKEKAALARSRQKQARKVSSRPAGPPPNSPLRLFPMQKELFQAPSQSPPRHSTPVR